MKASETIVLRDWRIDVSPEMILRFQGADPGLVRSRNPAAWYTSVRAAKDSIDLLEPRVIYREIAIVGLRHERLLLENSNRLAGAGISRFLGNARAIIVAVCTIGELVEQAVSRAFPEDPAYALALDAFGSLAIDRLASSFCSGVAERLTERNEKTTIPLSPGMEGWPVQTGQQQIFGLLDAHACGIKLTDSSLMIPLKSTSFVIGLGPDVSSEGNPCDFCTLRHNCRYQEHYAQLA